MTKKIAELQQQFYFTNTSITDDYKYMWISCHNHPSQATYMAVVSLDENDPSIKAFPGIGSSEPANIPMIIPGTHDIIFAEMDTVYRADTDGNVTKILSLPEEFVNHRQIQQVFTHASVSCDGKNIALDIRIAEKTYIAVGNLETGEVTILNKFGRYYDHAMFSPVDPNLMIIDQDRWRDGDSGEYFPINNRIWLMDIRKTRFEPLLQNSWYYFDGTDIAHDFWAKDGFICWADYPNGAYECDINTRKPVCVWKRPVCHCHTIEREFWCADQSPYAWNEKPCEVLFFDRKTGKEIDIFSALPAPKIPRKGSYHLDPHPSFTKDSEYIVSTVTVFEGNADIAITPVRPLIELCRKNGRKVE